MCDKKIQEEINKKTPQAQKKALAGVYQARLLSTFVLLMMMCTKLSSTNKVDNTLTISGYLAFIACAYIQAANKKIDAENGLIYDGLTKRNNEEDQLISSHIKENILKADKSSIIGGIGMITGIFVLNHQGIALMAGSSILIAAECYTQHLFKQNNRLLKAALPKGIQLPNIKKNPFRERG